MPNTRKKHYSRSRAQTTTSNTSTRTVHRKLKQPCAPSDPEEPHAAMTHAYQDGTHPLWSAQTDKFSREHEHYWTRPGYQRSGGQWPCNITASWKTSQSTMATCRPMRRNTVKSLNQNGGEASEITFPSEHRSYIPRPKQTPGNAPKSTLHKNEPLSASSWATCTKRAVYNPNKLEWLNYEGTFR